MKIAIFHNLESGGAKRALFEMTKGLATQGHELWEIAPSTADIDWCSLEPFTYKQEIFPFSWPVWEKRIPFLTPYLSLATSIKGRRDYFRMSERINDWLESLSFDLLFAHDCMFFSNPVVVGMTNIPNVLYIHHGSYLAGEAEDSNPRSNTSLKATAKRNYYLPASYTWERIRHSTETWAGRRASVVACNSELARLKIREAYSRESRVIHYGVDNEKFHPELQLNEDNYVFSAGNINQHKSFDFLIRSLATLPRSIRPNLRVAALHQDEEVLNSLISLADELGVVFNVLRPKSDVDLIRLYNQAKAFVFAARFEPFGMVALEAMACGKPIVGVEDGGYVDCISDEETGFITPRSPLAFGQALAKLLENPDLRMKMGIAGRERARKYWTWDRCSDDLSQFFSEMLHP